MLQLGPARFTLRQLQYAVAVADARSFRAAARRCLVSQPALSAQVAELEAALGVRLFERDRRSVRLTRAGSELVERARQVLVLADDVLEVAKRHLDPLSGLLRLGVIPTMGPYLLPELDPALRRAFPAATPMWTEDKTENLVEQVSRGALDGALLALEADLGGLEHQLVGRDLFVLATPRDHALARAPEPVPLRALDDQRVLLLDEGHCLRDQALELCTRAGAEELGFRATSLGTLAQMVAGGSGITLLPRTALEVENRRGALTVRRFAEPVPYRTVVLAWRRGSALAEALGQVARVARDAFERAWPVAAPRAAPAARSARRRRRGHH